MQNAYVYCTYMYMYMYISVFDKLIWCTQGGSYLALHSSFFGSYGTVNCNYIVTNTALIGVFPMADTLTIVEPIWPMVQNLSKHVHVLHCFLYIMYRYVLYLGFIKCGEREDVSFPESSCKIKNYIQMYDGLIFMKSSNLWIYNVHD